MDALNATARILSKTQQIYGCVVVAGGAITSTALSGEAISDQAQVTVTRTATGVFTIAVSNFRGENSVVNALVTTGTTSLNVNWTAKTYTANTDTVTVTVSIEDDASTLTDASFDFQLTAY